MREREREKGIESRGGDGVEGNRGEERGRGEGERGREEGRGGGGRERESSEGFVGNTLTVEYPVTFPDTLGRLNPASPCIPWHFQLPWAS